MIVDWTLLSLKSSAHIFESPSPPHAVTRQQRTNGSRPSLVRWPLVLGADFQRSQIAKRIGVSPRAARTRLASLVERGLVAEIGSGPQDPHRRYHLVSDAPW